MKSEYLELEMEIIEFESEDIITRSGGGPDGGGNGLPFDNN